MEIRYPTYSRFLRGCEEAIRRGKMSLLKGDPIKVEFSPQGYNARIRVRIDQTKSETFWADWESADPTRFPVRIKAAAYALFRLGCYGTFLIKHKTGILTIQYLGTSSEISSEISDEILSEPIQESERSNLLEITKKLPITNKVKRAKKLYFERDIEKCRKVAEILYNQFYKSKEGLFGHREMPEDLLPQGVERGSYSHIMFITLTVAIDYQRDAVQLWNASRRTFEDKSTQWIYFPNQLVERSDSELLGAMQKYSLVKKVLKDALKIWKPVSMSFHKLFNSDPRNLFKEMDYDAFRLYTIMNTKYKRYFPYLSGKKILPLWLRLLHDVVGIELKNLDKIPIPVDIHIARATFCLGCLKGTYKGPFQDAIAEINGVWEEACENFPLTRLQLDGPLWNLSKYGCSHRTNQFCPKSSRCPVSQFCIPGKIYVSPEKIDVMTWNATPKRKGKGKLIIVQCGGKKIWNENPLLGPVPAKDAYTSPYFKLNKAYAEKFGDHWLILSAKYGFLEPTQEIENYNVTFKKLSSDCISDDKLKNQVRSRNLSQYKVVIVLGGEDYYQKARSAFEKTDCIVKSPLRGMPIGVRMAKIRQALSTGIELE